MSVTPSVKPIAFYLPQFHSIPENDEWWGKGFTEWTNVRKAKPLFLGHYQPHVPGQLGYYDLRDPEARIAQAELAHEYGIHGFCYYHYWFNGKRLLETPLNEVLASGQPNFPFCLCWANENWTRRWDGQDREILIAQNYSHEDDLNFINDLIPAFRDERYIRVNGKPLLLVYRTSLLPHPGRTTTIWREAMHKAGVGDLYLVRIENFLDGLEVTPTEIGFDAAVEFAPFGRSATIMSPDQLAFPSDAQGREPIFCDYEKCMLTMLARPEPQYKLFRGVFPSWDNSARRKHRPTIFLKYSPEKYAFWLAQVARYTLNKFNGDECLLFINAWNEWGEGCHLEPDEKHGLRYLEATCNSLRLAGDFYAVENLLGVKETGELPFDMEKWERRLAACYANRGHISEIESGILATFAPYAFFTMASMAEKDICRQLWTIIEERDKTIKDIYNTYSWRVTAPLRKLRDVLTW